MRDGVNEGPHTRSLLPFVANNMRKRSIQMHDKKKGGTSMANSPHIFSVLRKHIGVSEFGGEKDSLGRVASRVQVVNMPIR